ncbi:hypothetical protein AAHE18_19G145000 [Arachis hypogaea]
MYAFVALFNVTMWGCFVNSLKSLSSLQATVTNFATNFISSGLAGFFFFFHESLSPQEFSLIDKKELAPLQELIESIVFKRCSILHFIYFISVLKN